jgi:hypothetical protein
LLTDTAKGAVVTRWENLMSTNRAIVLGLLATIAVLAALSDGPRTAVPIILAVAIASRLVVRGRAPHAVVATSPTRGWRGWLATGGVLVAVAVGLVISAGDDELLEWQWMVMFGSLLGGIFATITAGILYATARRSPALG